MRELLRPKWIVGHVLFLAFVVTFLGLGTWQLRRNTENAERVRTMTARLAEAEIDLAGVDALPPGERAFRRVSATGTYDPSAEVVLVGRSMLGEPGNHILTPLVLADGTAVLVDRGWVPFPLNDPPVARAEPPEGEVTVRGVLLPPAQTSRGDGVRPERVRLVDTAVLSQGLDSGLREHYLLLAEQDPEGGRLPIPAERPDSDSGSPHLSYAVQWLSLAVVSVIGYTALIRKEVRGARRRAEPVAEAPA